MYVSKAAIIATLRSRGLPARADWVDRELPEFIDVDKNAGLLATLHINPAHLSPTEAPHEANEPRPFPKDAEAPATGPEPLPYTAADAP